MRIQIVLTLPREAGSVPLARHTVSEALRTAGVARDCVAEVAVALSEACTNVFHHAGEGEDYEIVINIRDEQLTIDVLDSGAILAPRPAWPAAAMPDTSAERGRGLALMAAMTDQATFDSVTGDGGSVHLVKRLRWAEKVPLLASANGGSDGAARRGGRAAGG